jgi:serine protease Do
MVVIMRALLLPLFLLGPAVAAESDLRQRMLEAKNRVFPALVHIINVEEGFRGGVRVRNVNSGSGFFIDAEGHVVTNYHVAGQAKKLFVTLANKRKVHARVVAGDPYTDLAILQVDPTEAFADGKPVFAGFGDSDRLEEGDFVMAMGSPLSLARSVSFGIISCRDRLLNTMRVAGHETGKYNTWLQTDAAINPGNSGGPLVNLSGEVVGVNTRANLAANDIGYAIPSNVVQRVVRDLLKHATVPRSWLGLKLQALDTVADTALDITKEGVLLAEVAWGSPAREAGLEPGDLIVGLNDEPFTARFDEEVPALYQRVADLPADKEASLIISRDGELRKIRMRPVPLGRRVGREAAIPQWGITVMTIPERRFAEYGIEDGVGVIVTGIRPGSPASGKLEREDIIREVDAVAIRDLATILRLARESEESGEKLVRLIVRRGQILDVALLRPDYGEDR